MSDGGSHGGHRRFSGANARLRYHTSPDRHSQLMGAVRSSVGQDGVGSTRM